MKNYKYLLFSLVLVALFTTACGDNGQLNTGTDPTLTDFDIDDDGFGDEFDNCPSAANTDQADVDGDGVGDACDDSIDDDDDNDGYTTETDCDDTNAAINPGATEICEDGIDQNCDDADDVCGGGGTETDTDGDGVTDTADNCISTANADQTDTDSDASGDACDDDDDGDGVVDSADNCSTTVNADQADSDSDGTGDECDSFIDKDGDGYSDDFDCADEDATIYPGATEVCDVGGDENCDPTDDVCPDADGDGYTTSTDCDDSNAAINPAAADECIDGIDGDCDGTADDDMDLVDMDCDGYATDGSTADVDCDDEDAAINQGATEVFNFVDDNCDLFTDDFSLTSSSLTIDGAAIGDWFGYVVANAGDVDGDGYEDILVSAPYNDDAASNAGKVYLFFGASSLTGSLTAANADASFEGEARNDQAGISVAGAGDVDGDGKGDIIIGAYYNNSGGSDAGRVYIIFGKNIVTGTHENLSAADVIITGAAANDNLGSAVASAGDVNGDGKDDVLIGAKGFDATTGLSAGKIYVFSGSSLNSSTALADANKTYEGEAAGDSAGSVLAPAGDVDADGNDDFLVGVFQNDQTDTSAGKVYVVFGDNSGTSLSDSDITFTGEAAYDYAGSALVGNVDLNADGLSDIIIGAKGNDTVGSDSGKLYVIYGDSALTGNYSLGASNIIYTGEAAGDQAGLAVAASSDLNGDTLGELITAAPYADPTLTDQGKVYVINGQAKPETTQTFSLSLANSSFVGENTNDYVSNSLAAADVNNDGLNEILVGVKYYDVGTMTNGGRVYVLFKNQ